MNYVDGLLSSLTRVKEARTLRASSWDTTGRNNDAWDIALGETRVIGDTIELIVQVYDSYMSQTLILTDH